MELRCGLGNGDGGVEWRVRVLDATSRGRDVVVTVRDGRVIVEPPPPAGFSMNAAETDQLAGALFAAAGYARIRARRPGCAGC